MPELLAYLKINGMGNMMGNMRNGRNGYENELNTDLDDDASNDRYTKMLMNRWSDMPSTIFDTKQIVISGPHVIALYSKHDVETYGWALLMSYELYKPIYCVMRNGVWVVTKYL